MCTNIEPQGHGEFVAVAMALLEGPSRKFASTDGCRERMAECKGAIANQNASTRLFYNLIKDPMEECTIVAADADAVVVCK